MREGRGHHFLLAAILLSPLAALSDAPESAPADAGVTVLEPVFVEASTGDPWIHFTVPGFEVISHCPDNFNRTYARALEMANAARLAVLPREFWGDLPTPMKIVLYDRPPEPRNGFIRGSPIDLNWTPGGGGSVGEGLVEHSYPVTVGDGDTYISCGNYWSVQEEVENFSVDPDSDIRLKNRLPRLPSWFEAGFEGPFGLYPNRIIQMAMLGDTLLLPSATWISSEETLAVQNEAREKQKDGKVRRPRDMLPLAELFHGAPAERSGLWNSEASLFVRWGLYAGGDRRSFLDFVDAASREPVTQELFRKYLGMGYAEAQQRLGDYLFVAVGEPIRVPLAAPADPPLNLREATSVEVARIIGDWGRLEGRLSGIEYLEYQRECMDQADKLFERIHGRRNSDPYFLAAYGLYEAQIGYSERAREALESATGAGVVRPRAYVELARLRLDEALPSVQQGIGDLDRADFTAIVSLLTTARVQMPSLLVTYELLAHVLEHAPSKPTRGDLVPLERAVHLFPQDVPLACTVANLLRDDGYGDVAAAIVDRARRFSDSDEGRALLAEFQARKPR